MYTNPDNLRAALAYARDSLARGRTEVPIAPHARAFNMWDGLRKAGAYLKGDSHGLYPWAAFMHHAHEVSVSASYARRAWSLGVYPVDLFEEYATTARITRTLDGALFVAHAEANSRTLTRARGDEAFTLPFEKFAGVDIPADGYWVLVVSDVDNPSEAPELVYHRYTLSSAELREINTAAHPFMVPLLTTTAHHVHQLRSLGIETPRLLLRIAPTKSHAGWVRLQSASMEMHTEPTHWNQYAASELGDTLQSRTVDAESIAEPKSVKDTVDAIMSTHRVGSFTGYWTTPAGQSKLGAAVGSDGSSERRVTSAAVAELAIQVAIREYVQTNLAKIMDSLQEINPAWDAAGDTRDVAALGARLGVEALFMALSPDGRKSPVIAQLKRIYGDQGIPSIRDMLNGNSGLPATAGPAGGQAAVDAVLAAKVDMSMDRSVGVSEDYAAKVLSHVRSPVWGAEISPLAIAVLTSAMPATFVDDVHRVIRNVLDMKYAVLRHSRGSHDTRVHWTGRTTPGIYIEAPLDDFERMARVIAEMASSSNTALAGALRALVVVDKAVTVEALNHLTEGTEYSVGQLIVGAKAPAATVVFAQGNALVKANELESRVSFSPDSVMAMKLLHGLTSDGEALVVIVNVSSKQSMVVKFSVAPDRRMMVVHELMGAMAKAIISSTYTGGRAAWAQLRLAARVSRTYDAYAEEHDSADGTVSPDATEVARWAAMLRSWMQHSHVWVNVDGSVDSGLANVEAVHDDNNSATIKFAGHDRVSQMSAPIGIGMLAIAPSEGKVSVNNNAHTINLLRVGPSLYVRADQLDLLAAAQNEAISHKETIAEETDFHDPYETGRSSEMSKIAALDAGKRKELAQSSSFLVLDNVGRSGVSGVLVSHDHRNDPSKYYSGVFDAHNSWYNPYH